MEESIDSFEQEPHKRQMSKKKKNLLTYSALAMAGLLFAALVLWGVASFVSGESAPEKAVASYLRASLLYDHDGLVEYASEYQKQSLQDGNYSTDKKLREFLSDYYSGVSSLYADNNITFLLDEARDIKEDSVEYLGIIAKYGEKADASKIKAVSKITMTTVIDGKKQAKRTYIAVKYGLRWYYGYADA